MKDRVPVEHLMTTEEVADILHVDPATIRRLINRGELTAYRIGADYRFAPSDLESYLLRQRIAGGEGYGRDSRVGSPPGRPDIPVGDREQWEKFSEQAKRALQRAQEEAQRLHRNYIGPEHILLGLLDGDDDDVAVGVLRNLLIDLDQVRHQVRVCITRGERLATGAIGLTPGAKKVIAFALDEAQYPGHRAIGTEHLLLALFRLDEGIAADVLKSLRVGLEQVRTQMLAVRQSQPTTSLAVASEDHSERVCIRCGTRCPKTFHYCFNCGQPFIHEE